LYIWNNLLSIIKIPSGNLRALVINESQINLNIIKICKYLKFSNNFMDKPVIDISNKILQNIRKNKINTKYEIC